MIIFTIIENAFCNSLKLRNYRGYILCTGIGGGVISVDSTFSVLCLDMKLNLLNKCVVFWFFSAKLACTPYMVMFKIFTVIFDDGIIFQFLGKLL